MLEFLLPWVSLISVSMLQLVVLSPAQVTLQIYSELRTIEQQIIVTERATKNTVVLFEKIKKPNKQFAIHKYYFPSTESFSYGMPFSKLSKLHFRVNPCQWKTDLEDWRDRKLTETNLWFVLSSNLNYSKFELER